MDRIRIILLNIIFGLTFFFVHGQQIGNYVNNGSFETLYNCQTQPSSQTLKYWSCLDSSKLCALVIHKCWGIVPYASVGFQYPKDGDSYLRFVVFGYNLPPPANFSRSNIRNRLKQPLSSGKTYCVKMYVNLPNDYPNATDAFGIYFGGSDLDTINYNARLPLTFLTPQVSNPPGNYISDTLRWIPVSGTFVATGNEKYMILSNFKSDLSTNTITVPTSSGYSYGCEYFIDAVSCLEYDLPAYAGPDQAMIPGDSVFIGRPSDFATDSACIWYKLPNMTTAIDTISGLWVKPVTTSTYIVKQQLECSSLKWDTVVVYMNLVGLDKLKFLSDNISLFPNPASNNLNVSFSGSVRADFRAYNITNNLGQIIREDEFDHGDSTFTMSTSDLVSGLYQIHFNTQFGIVTKKFAKIN